MDAIRQIESTLENQLPSKTSLIRKLEVVGQAAYF
jgi:hypothetical protein